LVFLYQLTVHSFIDNSVIGRQHTSQSKLTAMQTAKPITPQDVSRWSIKILPSLWTALAKDFTPARQLLTYWSSRWRKHPGLRCRYTCAMSYTGARVKAWHVAAEENRAPDFYSISSCRQMKGSGVLHRDNFNINVQLRNKIYI